LLSVLYELLSTLPEKFYIKAVLNDSLLDPQGKIDNQKLIEGLCQEMKIKHIDVFYDFYDKQFKEQLHWVIYKKYYFMNVFLSYLDKKILWFREKTQKI